MKIKISILAAGLLLISPGSPARISPSHSGDITLATLVGTAFADGCTTDRNSPAYYPNCAELSYPHYVTVWGHQITLPNTDCVNRVEQALRENRLVPVDEVECRNGMKRALEMQRTEAPPPDSAIKAAPTILRSSSAITIAPNAN